MPRRHFLANRADDVEILEKGARSDADALFVDLEDGVAPSRKATARENVAEAFAAFDYADKYRVVRLNDLAGDVGKADLRVLRHEPEAVMLPKVETPEDVRRADARIAEREAEYGLEAGSTDLFVMIETSRALLSAVDVFDAAPRLSGAFFGPADLSVDLGCLSLDERFHYPDVVTWSRYRFIAAARAAGLDDVVGGVLASKFDAPDEVFSEARSQFVAGHTGLLVITPRHVEVVNEAYRPTDEQLAYAKEVIAAFEEIDSEGLGVAALNEQLLELPMYRVARRIVEMENAGG